MCGILAILTGVERVVYEESIPHLERRGPDKTVVKSNEETTLIFTRLAINDVSALGDQPMEFEGAILMCNGEIYTHKQIRTDEKFEIESNSDCAVILPLYKKYGFVGMANRIYGVYAMVILDGDKVFYLRDRMGIRPLFTGWYNGKLCIASIVNALTPFATDIKEVEPGVAYMYSKSSNIVVSLQKEPIMRTVFNGTNGTNGTDEEESVVCNTIRNLLTDAVKTRLLSDRPIGCLLSGGLDSSLVTSILVKLLGSEKVRTYSIGMKGSTDLHYAKVVATALGTDHTEIVFRPEDGLKVIPTVIEALGSYDITTIRASIGMYLISDFISDLTEDVVIFTGEGSDELFGGYLYFHNAPTDTDAMKETLRLLRNIHRYDVLRADRCISSNGLEPRVPFLDKKLVDYVLNIPVKYKRPIMKDGKPYEKYILRKAFEGYLPVEVLWRRKEGFSDGVSSLEKPWYQHIQEFCEGKIPEEVYNSERFPSKEAQYYRGIFDKLFPRYDLNLPYWMPLWSDSKDPSGRLISAFNK